jgi:hypothetical protein
MPDHSRRFPPTSKWNNLEVAQPFGLDEARDLEGKKSQLDEEKSTT